ncbi:MAG: VOC family protein [Blastochloris viridis]|uniref:VOC family protein n=1 Tax=Blastochloris viridis TaxID=1079 RepID=A0A6N4R301_BLAVI|nr:MAG: VOC family protein [Blastochloris viridis]
MINHISVGTSNYARAKAFYTAVFETLGYVMVTDFGDACGFGKDGELASFWLTDTATEQMVGFHVAFSTASPDAVDAFYTAALAHGGKDNGAPGLRPEYSPTYYAAFVISPDGHHLEAVHGR